MNAAAKQRLLSLAERLRSSGPWPLLGLITEEMLQECYIGYGPPFTELTINRPSNVLCRSGIMPVDLSIKEGIKREAERVSKCTIS